ncbi:hypothetical protein [Desulfobacca acetoxidans]|jgi:hypothetical protein|nr:hypothetical protein [Desulfobacterales bacterium]
MKRVILSRLTGITGAGLFLTALAGLIRGLEPFATWFYSFAWWSYIMMADALIFQYQGSSLLMNRFRELPRLAVSSITCWLIFEAANLILGNWHYRGLPEPVPLRWLGYLLGFATVFPGLFQTKELLGLTGLLGQDRTTGKQTGTSWLAPCAILGVILLMLPLQWPRYGFPFIWLAFIFLLEPFCFIGGGRSLWDDWAKGQRRDIYLWMSAGMLCGFFWECWNYWAKAKWIYTLPFFNRGRIFEMPILGYLGFAPFALECVVMYNFIRMLEEQYLSTAAAGRRWLFGQMIFWLLMFLAIDHWTVLAGVAG